MSSVHATCRLSNPVSHHDHVLGPESAPVTLVEYGCYVCDAARKVNVCIADLRDSFGDRIRYVFRHFPAQSSDLARRAAELMELVKPEDFWAAHLEMMTRSEQLCEEDLDAIIERFNVHPTEQERQAARMRIDADIRSANASDVMIAPTFFINGRRYDGAWDKISLSDAINGTLGHRFRVAALDFARWGPSAGVMLMISSILALIISNSPFSASFEQLWRSHLGIHVSNFALDLSMRHWVNDGLLTFFFLVVGLEIKREFTVGHLTQRRTAALPIMAALGGIAVPALLYLLIVPSGEQWARGWGVPLSTDTAFAIALIAMLGSRVPIELRIFLTAAAIVDDIVSILVVALFYSANLHYPYMAAALMTIILLVVLNRSSIYHPLPYILLGLMLWFFVHQSGLHATLSGVVLALLIPTLPPPNAKALMSQAQEIVSVEDERGEILSNGLSEMAMRTLERILWRLESPADRMLRVIAPWSSYFVLPVFAFANAGVVVSVSVIDGHQGLIAAIMAGLILGKPIGILGASALAVRSGLASKPDEFSWAQLLGAGFLAGIGFTMSLFIAGQAFSASIDFDAAKIAVFSASVIAALIGLVVLWLTGEKKTGESRESQRASKNGSCQA
ncbi:MAG: Na+/H+ antiporter NhaA [Burkholderiales bacterium]|nr:Na+/H+ antiporter NhaA [Burkholderiales bacterium]